MGSGSDLRGRLTTSAAGSVSALLLPPVDELLPLHFDRKPSILPFAEPRAGPLLLRTELTPLLNFSLSNVMGIFDVLDWPCALLLLATT